MPPLLQPTLLLLLLLSQASCTPRVVVTFRNASLNAEATPPENTTVVKQYGRRLVLRATEGEISEEWVQEALGGEAYVERVEADVVAAVDVMADVIAAAGVSPVSLDSIRSGWNLDENEPYGLHIQSIRALTDGQGATLAIIDSGVAEAAKPVLHPATGYDFISSPEYSNTPDQSRNPDYTDPGDQGPACPTPSWHGTKVASVAAAIAPGATLTVMRVLGQCGVGFSSDIADAVVWAAGGKINGLGMNPFPASVISLSLAGRSQCPTYLQSAITQARSLGTIVIVAAGNAAQDTNLYFPANCYGVMAVGASTRQGTRATYSNFGSRIICSAQGGDTNNPIPVLGVTNGQLAKTFATGTSFSAPHVAGFITLVGNIGLQIDSVALVSFSFCDSTSGDACNGILSSLYPRSDQKPMLPSPNKTTSGQVNVNSSMAVASQNDCPAGQWRNCISACFLNIGSCRNSWCEECQDCPSGYYCPGNNEKVDCQLIATVKGCFGIRYLSGCGTSSSGECVTKVCQSTEYMSSSNYVCYTCDRCGGGYYASGCGGMSEGTCTSCATDCPDTQYRAGCSSNNPGWCASCSDCSSGQKFGGCGGGGLSDSRTCSSCDAGTYGGGGKNRACASCGAGKYNPNTGSAYESACQACPAGKFNPNTGSNSAGACQSCAAGKNLLATGATSSDNCANCAVGKYSPGAGTGVSCTPCAAGSYTNALGTSQCTPCAAGSYAATTGLTACTPCGVGKYSATVGANAESTCQSCAAGTYNVNQGGASYLACTKCDPGKYGLTAAATDCMSCTPGKYSTASGRNTACDSCGTGKYNPDTGGALVASCANCDPGKYGPSIGLSACPLCLIGTYAATTGNVACSACSSTTYTTIQGTVQCQTCPVLANCAIGTEYTCVANTGSLCVPCAVIYACEYLTNTCFSGSDPSCLCAAGFEMVGGRCVGCGTGKYKSNQGNAPCATITTPVCGRGQYLQPGSAYANAVCVDCPVLPPNAAQAPTGCDWTCNAGFDNNAP